MKISVVIPYDQEQPGIKLADADLYVSGHAGHHHTNDLHGAQPSHGRLPAAAPRPVETRPGHVLASARLVA